MDKCPCNKKVDYLACCGRFIEGAAKASTAEELMRSRYTAHVKVEMDYIMATVHPSNRQKSDRSEVESWAKSTDWDRLEIIRTKDGKAEDLEGRVTFVAYYKEGMELKRHAEDSYFVKEQGQWFYVNGKTPIFKTKSKPTNSKIGRNDPCRCGSGKKYKKCCGK